jgi:DNA mismatch repair protein MutL
MVQPPAAAAPVPPVLTWRPMASAPLSGPPASSASAPGPVASPAGGGPATWRWVGTAHGAYGVFETPAGLVLVDRRAAHERIWFERLQDEFRADGVASQRLLLPVPVELDPVASALLIDRQRFLHRYGFEIEEFGRNFFRIEAVPTWLEPADAEGFVRDLLGAMRDGRLPESNVDLAREELARLAAGKAVRLPESIGAGDWQALVAQLFACRAPHLSPAGRATHVELSHGELARRFQK